MTLDTLVNLGADAAVVATLLWRVGALSAVTQLLGTRLEELHSKTDHVAEQVAKLEQFRNGVANAQTNKDTRS